MRSKSINGNSAASIETALQKSITDGFIPTLAFVFISIKQDSKAVCEILTTAGIDCIGATSCNEFIDGRQSEGAIAILLLDTDKANYSILTEDIGDKTVPEAGACVSKAALACFSTPSLILLSSSLMENGGMLDGETLIRSIENNIGSQVNIFGGMAGDDMSFTGPYVFSNRWQTRYGVAAVVFNQEKITMYGVALSGWKSIGVSRTITKSNKNLLYEIDGKPALETYLRFLGEDDDATQDRSKFFDGVGLHYP